ncbi:hypothetical protein RB11748 [Rhodopirellula baltica SH 1]|uniref:Uncharacterized protein n=1 Tax=Rhodopirellula baltica (strain DSM 10527 / NCIMB 13988 / SH1) TaxID=243090 RepID=Q7UDW1_RHOBA|nr:hypothetical protein RB11748 [Rhodopirellula baltica SH 1]
MPLRILGESGYIETVPHPAMLFHLLSDQAHEATVQQALLPQASPTRVLSWVELPTKS